MNTTLRFFAFSLVLTTAILAWPQSPSAVSQPTTPTYAAPSAQPSSATLPTLPADVARVRAALEKYQDPVVAIHDGYLSTLGCIEIPEAGSAGRVPYKPGAMGVHFLNPRLVGPDLDPMHPQILLYAPDRGKLRLVGAEWFVPLSTGVKQRPSLFGQPFWGPMEGHHPLMPAAMQHYDLHVWMFTDNPLGLFSATDPTIKCDGYPYLVKEQPPLLVPEPKP